MRRIFAVLVCLLILPSAALAEPLSTTVQEMVAAIEAQLDEHTFQDMRPEAVAVLAREQGAYRFVGRRNQDGTVRYLLGSLKPGADKPDMRGYDETPDGLWNLSRDGNFMLMQPGVAADFVATPVGELFYICANEPGGLEKLRNATRNGVRFNKPQPPFAVVYIHDRLGAHVEYIPLNAAQLDQFQRDKALKNPGGNQYSICYTLGEKDEDGYDKYVRPQYLPESLLQLAIDKCGYEPPFKLAKVTLTKAVLTVHNEYGVVQHTQTLSGAKSLKKLVQILRTAKTEPEGKCGYYGELTLTLKNGMERHYYKGMDSCGSIMMGSGASMRFSKKSDRAFWALFAALREATLPKGYG